MIKPWYTHGCETMNEWNNSHNIARMHSMFWFLSASLGLDFDRDHVLNFDEIIRDDVIDWYHKGEYECSTTENQEV